MDLDYTIWPPKLSDLLASMALFLSTISILLQTMGVRRQIARQNFSDYCKRYSETFRTLPREALTEDFDFFVLTPDQQEELIRISWAYFDLCYEQYLLRREKLISKRLWKIWEKNMAATMRRPFFQQCWAIVRHLSAYNTHPEFIQLFESFAQGSSAILDQKVRQLLSENRFPLRSSASRQT